MKQLQKKWSNTVLHIICAINKLEFRNSAKTSASAGTKSRTVLTSECLSVAEPAAARLIWPKTFPQLAHHFIILTALEPVAPASNVAGGAPVVWLKTQLAAAIWNTAWSRQRQNTELRGGPFVFMNKTRARRAAFKYEEQLLCVWCDWLRSAERKTIGANLFFYVKLRSPKNKME